MFSESDYSKRLNVELSEFLKANSSQKERADAAENVGVGIYILNRVVQRTANLTEKTARE